MKLKARRTKKNWLTFTYRKYTQSWIRRDTDDRSPWLRSSTPACLFDGRLARVCLLQPIASHSTLETSACEVREARRPIRPLAIAHNADLQSTLCSSLHGLYARKCKCTLAKAGLPIAQDCGLHCARFSEFGSRNSASEAPVIVVECPGKRDASSPAFCGSTRWNDNVGSSWWRSPWWKVWADQWSAKGTFQSAE